MTFGWGGVVSEGSCFYIYVFTTILRKSIFCCVCGLLLVSFYEVVVYFGKAESIVISLIIYIPYSLQLQFQNCILFFLYCLAFDKKS